MNKQSLGNRGVGVEVRLGPSRAGDLDNDAYSLSKTHGQPRATGGILTRCGPKGDGGVFPKYLQMRLSRKGRDGSPSGVFLFVVVVARGGLAGSRGVSCLVCGGARA